VRRGFTLVELLIVMVVAAVIASVVVPSMMGGRDQHRVKAAARTLLAHARRARVDAVTSGKRTQLIIDLDDAQDPFEAPGQFQPAMGPWGRPGDAGENVEIIGVRIGASGRPLDDGADSVQEGEVVINFLPEGSASAAQVWLAAGLHADEQLVIDIDGLTGRVRVLTPDEAQAESATASVMRDAQR